MLRNCQKSLQVFIAICLTLQTSSVLGNTCPKFYEEASGEVFLTTVVGSGKGDNGNGSNGGSSSGSSGSVRMDALSSQMLKLGDDAFNLIKTFKITPTFDTKSSVSELSAKIRELERELGPEVVARLAEIPSIKGAQPTLPSERAIRAREVLTKKLTEIQAQANPVSEIQNEISKFSKTVGPALFEKFNFDQRPLGDFEFGDKSGQHSSVGMADIRTALQTKLLDFNLKGKSLDTSDYLRVFARDLLFGKPDFSKVSETEGSHLKQLGILTSPISARETDPVLVLGDGFSGTVARELIDLGYVNLKSVDTVYTQAEVARWNEKNPEQKVELESYDERGNAKDLKKFDNESQAFVGGHNLLQAIKPSEIGKVIGSISRVLQVGSEGRLSFAGKGSRILKSHLELIVQATNMKDGPSKLSIVMTDGKKGEGYLRIEKNRTSKKAGEGSDPDITSFSSFVLFLIEKVQFGLLSEKIAEKIPGKGNMSTFSAQSKSGSELKMFEAFLEMFIEPYFPKIRSNPAKMKSLYAYFYEKIYAPIAAGRTLEAAMNLRFLEGGDLMNVMKEGYTFVENTASGLKVHVITAADSLNNLDVVNRVQSLTLDGVKCTTTACLNSVQNFASPAVDAAFGSLKKGLRFLKNKN
jgi:hypothetical protein